MMGLSLGRSGVAGASLGSVIPAELVPDADVLAQLESFAVDLASGAGRLVVTERPEGMEVDTKTTETDVVTEMDRRAQEYLVGRIRRIREGDGVLGEEEGGALEVGESGLTWVLDPIDGTVNYLYDRMDFAVSVSVVVGDVSAPG
ncbi:inositol monophosphatase, partial [Dermatophilus congolensis]|nr:inositol monophosphatase [Dermatophilus congolensis]